VMLDTPELDPYGPDNPTHAAEPGFKDFFVSGLATALKRFRGRSEDWRLTAAGGVIAHTPDNYPVCDWVADDVYAIVDSGHGFKTLAIGKLAAAEITERAPEPLLEPFRLGRFERGELLTASKGPYPWT
jgi:methylglutamate dehydrogenase subunit A